METRYTFSLNGSDWTGEYTSRPDARAAAINAAHRQTQPPGVVYVGKIIPADPQSAHHAELLTRTMSERAARAGVNQYLSGLKPDQLRDLDQALSQTLDSWLDRHHLRPTQFGVQAISEYPVPTAPLVTQPSEKEVSDLGPPRQVA
ncbi:MAG TPA: hypothetical protein VGG19_04630 [Tepidisphaeraceae bacterium]